jgi:hypothetical protein
MLRREKFESDWQAELTGSAAFGQHDRPLATCSKHSDKRPRRHPADASATKYLLVGRFT